MSLEVVLEEKYGIRSMDSIDAVYEYRVSIRLVLEYLKVILGI